MSLTVIYATTDDERLANEIAERLHRNHRKAIVQRVNEMARRGDPLTPRTAHVFAVVAESVTDR